MQMLLLATSEVIKLKALPNLSHRQTYLLTEWLIELNFVAKKLHEFFKIRTFTGADIELKEGFPGLVSGPSNGTP